MYRVYKYPIPITDAISLDLPASARILSVGWQGHVNELVIWALVDTTVERTNRWTFFIRGTGHPADDVADCLYLGTVQTHDGRLVWHVFYRI